MLAKITGNYMESKSYVKKTTGEVVPQVVLYSDGETVKVSGLTLPGKKMGDLVTLSVKIYHNQYGLSVVAVED